MTRSGIAATKIDPSRRKEVRGAPVRPGTMSNGRTAAVRLRRPIQPQLAPALTVDHRLSAIDHRSADPDVLRLGGHRVARQTTAAPGRRDAGLRLGNHRPRLVVALLIGVRTGNALLSIGIARLPLRKCHPTRRSHPSFPESR